jgi:uncharacterized protein (TIGR00251 family)
MIAFSEQEGVLEFAVRVTPRSSRSVASGEYNGALRVRVTSAPIDGAANDDLVNVLARAFDVARRDVEIASGASSKQKRVRIRGGSRHRLEGLAKGE